MLYPEAERGRGKKDEGRKSAEAAHFSYRSFAVARQILRESPTLAPQQEASNAPSMATARSPPRIRKRINSRCAVVMPLWIAFNPTNGPARMRSLSPLDEDAPGRRRQCHETALHATLEAFDLSVGNARRTIAKGDYLQDAQSPRTRAELAQGDEQQITAKQMRRGGAGVRVTGILECSLKRNQKAAVAGSGPIRPSGESSVSMR
jgi:hypothetical protein